MGVAVRPRKERDSAGIRVRAARVAQPVRRSGRDAGETPPPGPRVWERGWRRGAWCERRGGAELVRKRVRKGPSGSPGSPAPAVRPSDPLQCPGGPGRSPGGSSDIQASALEEPDKPAAARLKGGVPSGSQPSPQGKGEPCGRRTVRTSRGGLRGPGAEPPVRRGL